MTSRLLAWVFVSGYATVSAVVGAALLMAPKEAPPSAAPPTTTYVYLPPVSDDPTPSRVAMPVPEGFRRVAGPGGLVTTIPEDWEITRASGPGAMQATDPADPRRFVRYGGAPAPAAELLQSHVDYEAVYSRSKSDFRRLSLGTTTYHRVTAVDWEFEHEAVGGRVRVHSMYWRVAGTEYFLYAASSSDRWAETLPIYHAMIDSATP